MIMVFSTILLIAILFISITLHEYAHGWMAYKLGDPTPKLSGRLSLNPIAHVDPFGTVILPILLLVMSKGSFAFGYAKPVPINPSYFKNPKKDRGLVSAAGPLTNILIAIFLSLLVRLNFPFTKTLVLGIAINLILAMLNLIPIPPLDGSGIVASFLPKRLAYEYLKIGPYGIFIVLILIISGSLRRVLLPAVSLALNYLVGA